MSYRIIIFDEKTDKKYLKGIKAVSDEILSPGVLKDEDLELLGDSEHFCSFAVDENDNVCCVSFGRFFGISGAAEMMRCTEEEVGKVFPNVSKFAEHSGIAVLPEHRNKGLSGKMHALYLELVFPKADVVLYNVWNRRGGEADCVRALLRSGAVFLKKIPLYWYDDEELFCNLCNGRCKCDCDIYYIKKDGMKNGWKNR